MMHIAPWSSTLGIAITLADTLHGKTSVFLPRYQERLYLQTIEKYKIGVITIAPPLLVMLCKSKIADEYDLSSMELIYSGGAPIDLDTIHQVKKRYPHLKRVLQGYGMTELTGGLTEDSEITPKEGSVGPLAEGSIVKIVDPNTGKILGCREPGEIQVKGPVLFLGYIGIPSENHLTADGFYKTGDIAYYDEDGYFYIIDRIKELIKYNAWQVAPSELEALLLEHPGVMDAGVTGKPDPSCGELPTAFVVRQPNSKVTEEELLAHVDSKVSPWKKLRGGVFFINEIPKTASGKILRRKLKELLANSEKEKVRSKL
ncbi:luciferin 4-monooxygenase-like [Zerene cesonia]|uniref:luciferin 4-monooxygenase-like n=1 Tax=Zerene cesonia TaxID=33412 RepID=UPI0018E52381|nr:luciferin 4-monooxygenase-like [Zerene cesonia]